MQNLLFKLFEHKYVLEAEVESNELHLLALL